MDTKLIVSASPHVRSDETTQSLMANVIVALCPCVVASAIIFGVRALLVTAVSVVACVVFEWLYCKLLKRPNPISDLSAVVTGIILAMNVPVGMPIGQLIIGDLVAIIVVKQLFGGIGMNFANPALVGRIVLFISFAGSMNKWVFPDAAVDQLSKATPLAVADPSKLSLLDLFMGIHGGVLGETCALAIVLGLIYLVATKTISIAIPASYVGSVFVFYLIATKDLHSALVAVLSGGLLFGAVFMATDYVTSPFTLKGKLVYGVCLGIVTFAIRYWGTSAGAIIIAWVVTGIGIWFIANTFRILSAARPELTNGLYTYAEKGFGKLIGFFVAYGYWICNCFALVAYSVLVMATLNYFVPDFSGGNNIPSIIGGSIITWIMYLLALQGAKSTSFLNIIGTIGKLLPVAIFIIAVATVFKFSVFMEGFWGMKGTIDLTFSWDNVMPQVQATMLVTLWLFLGIEGAVVVSGKAKSQAAVRKATTIGFLVTLALYIIVSLLPLGVYSQADVGNMADPSMAAIMLDKFGKWGEILVNAGVIVSVLSSWLVWMLMLGEMPLAASKSGIFPKAFVKENKKGSPSTALLWTTIIVQIVLVISFFIGSNAWTTMISITSVMALPCYLFCTLFLFKIAIKKEYPKGIFASRNMAVFTGAAGSLYGLWLIYAAGLNYLMVACIVYAVGLPLYIVGVRQHDPKAKLFAKTSDKVIVAVVVALGIAGLIYSIVTFGHVKL